jgi:hypothetical protein
MRRPGTILGLAAPEWVRNQPEHQRPTTITTLNRVGAVVEDFNAAFDSFVADRLLTPEGKAANIAKAAVAAIAALDVIGAATTKVSDRATGIEKALLGKHAATLPKDVPFEALREIRDQLRDLTPAERLNLYRSPRTDPLVLLAIETGPPGLGSTRGDGSRRFEPFVDPEDLATARMNRAEALDPNAATTMKELRSLAEVYRLATNGVRKEIMDVAGVAVPEAV